VDTNPIQILTSSVKKHIGGQALTLEKEEKNLNWLSATPDVFHSGAGLVRRRVFRDLISSLNQN